MIVRLIVALILSALNATSAIADDIYRWTDPESGKVLVSPKPPSYPIKEKRTAGRLPNGDMVELILDSNAPEVKALIEKRKAREAEEKHIAEEQARQRAAREAEEAHIAAEQAKEKAAKEAKEWLENRENEMALQKKIAKAKSSKENDVQFMMNIMDEFIQYDKFASSTARIALAVPINNLLSTKMKLNSHSVVPCYEDSKSTLLQWMDLTIKSYYAFSAKEELVSVQYKRTADNNLKSFFFNLPDSCN